MTELPKTVLQRLAALAPGEHPAADLLAALVERRLAAAERERMLAHLAVCQDCRQIVWHSLPEEEAAQAAAPGRAPWRLWASGWRWAGAAAAVVVMATVALVYRGGPGPAGERAAAPSAPAAMAQSAERTAPLPASNAARAESKNVLRADSSPVPAATSRAGASIASAVAMPAMGKKKLAPPVLWMLSPRGALLRSTDSGKNWQAVPFAGNPVFRAVAVVGPKVWVGGVGGALYYSSDAGSQWTRLAPSDATRLNEDIRSLIFQDDSHGNLTTASGQSWTSSDGGHSWQKQ